MFCNMEPRNSNDLIEPRVNFEEIPLSALKQKSRGKLSVLLNPEKVLVSEDGHNRDWRGIFTLSGLTQSEYALISQTDDKIGKLLDLWMRKIDENKSQVTLSQLQQCFGIIDRYDVYDDTLSLFVEDSQAYLTNKLQARKNDENASSFEIIKRDPDNDIITEKDFECREKGLPLPIYDAFVIYNEKDIEFATELIGRLENIGYNLCAKDRDLLPGLSFESDAILSLLSKRCNRLIIIVSKAFLESPMQIFITNFAQALGIEHGQRKIIPCILEPGCNLPQMLRYCFRLDYFRNNKLFDFWDKLDKSLKVTSKDNKAVGHDKKLVFDKITTTTVIDHPKTTKELVYKFKETPTTPEKQHKNFVSEEEPVKQQIMPPPRRLRSSSSMMSLDTTQNGLDYKNKHSQSTLDLNGECSVDMTQSSKLKRKKWYSMFMPKEMKVKYSDVEKKDEKEKKNKRHWFKSKKKQKEKLAILAEA